MLPLNHLSWTKVRLLPFKLQHNSFHTKETPFNTRQGEFIHWAWWCKILYSTFYRVREVQLPLSHDCSLLFGLICKIIQNIRFGSYMQHFFYFSFSCSGLFLLFPTFLLLFGVKEIWSSQPIQNLFSFHCQSMTWKVADAGLLGLGLDAKMA